jgi:hypothetical protein
MVSQSDQLGRKKGDSMSLKMVLAAAAAVVVLTAAA